MSPLTKELARQRERLGSELMAEIRRTKADLRRVDELAEQELDETLRKRFPGKHIDTLKADAQIGPVVARMREKLVSMTRDELTSRLAIYNELVETHAIDLPLDD